MLTAFSDSRNLSNVFTEERQKEIRLAAPSKAWACGRSLAEIVGSNPTGGARMSVCCVLSGRGLCDGLIPRPEESYRVCVSN